MGDGYGEVRQERAIASEAATQIRKQQNAEEEGLEEDAASFEEGLRNVALEGEEEGAKRHPDAGDNFLAALANDFFVRCPETKLRPRPLPALPDVSWPPLGPQRLMEYLF